MKIAHVFISGFVQGIGFRQFILRQAQDLRLTGWVRNIPDGRVEAIFQGQKEKMKEMIALCRKGPFLAEVRGIEVRWEEGKGKFEDFEIT